MDRLGSLVIIDIKLAIMLKVDGIGPHPTSTIGTHLSHDALRDCSREDEATVVIGMFANKIDTTRCHIETALCTTKAI